jgi:hypothetical protein
MSTRHRLATLCGAALALSAVACSPSGKNADTPPRDSVDQPKSDAAALVASELSSRATPTTLSDAPSVPPSSRRAVAPAEDASCGTDADCAATTIAIESDGRCRKSGCGHRIVSQAYVKQLVAYCEDAGYSSVTEAVCEPPKTKCVTNGCKAG